MNSDVVVEVDRVTKEYALGSTKVVALRDVSLEIHRRDFVAVAGPSGSGKTTLLNLIGCVDVPTTGAIRIEGSSTTALSDPQLTQIRKHKLGYIFQTFNLFAVMSAFQNVELPLLLQGKLSRAKRRQRVLAALDDVGLASHGTHRPGELSGGQRQRVAIARALVTRPSLIIADEPTGNLDSHTSQQIVDLMRTMNQVHGTTFVFSTHDTKITECATRVIHVADGRIVSDEPNAAQCAQQATLEAAEH